MIKIVKTENLFGKYTLECVQRVWLKITPNSGDVWSRLHSDLLASFSGL